MDNKSGGQPHVVLDVNHLQVRTLDKIVNETLCKEKCQVEDYCEAFVFTENISDKHRCSLNTFGTADEIVNATGQVFGFKYCSGKLIILYHRLDF